MLKKGNPHPDGTGCIRKVSADKMKVIEEITKYEAPYKMNYQVIEINMPVIHHGGSIQLKEVEGGTHARWISKITMKSKNPLIRFIGGKVAKSKGQKGFGASLQWVKEKLEGAEAS